MEQGRSTSTLLLLTLLLASPVYGQVTTGSIVVMDGGTTIW